VVLAAVVIGACARPQARPGADAAPRATTPAVDAAPEVEAITGPSAYVIDAGTAAVGKPDSDRVLTIEHPLRGTDASGAPVYVARGDDPADLVRRAFRELDLKVPAGAHVVIKVNLGGFDRMKRDKSDDGVTGRVTNPALVRALVAELRQRGVNDLAIADGLSGPPEQLRDLLDLSGYAALLAQLQVPLVDLNHHGDARPRPFRLKLPWAKHLRDGLLLSAELVDPRRRTYLIDVPKLKAHRFAVMSLSIKNLMGAVQIGDAGGVTLPWRQRWRMHRELSPWLDAWKQRGVDDRPLYRAALAAFSERLADLYGVLTPDLVLIEGIPSMQGDGFAQVVPFGDRGILIASRNGCFADYVAAEFFGLADSDALEAELGVRMPPAILAVADRYYGGAAGLAEIEVRGDTEWRAAPRVKAWFKAMAPFQVGRSPR
jgi:uncharacterized protein (DUF362 family)